MEVETPVNTGYCYWNSQTHLHYLVAQKIGNALDCSYNLIETVEKNGHRSVGNQLLAWFGKLRSGMVIVEDGAVFDTIGLVHCCVN